MGTKKQREKIIQEIEKAFADTLYPGDNKLVKNLNHYEADEVIQDFKGKSWKEITVKMAYWHRLSLPLFTPEAFRFYLPGLIITALQAPARSKYNPGEILEFIFYNLVPVTNENNEITRLLDIIQGFTLQQKASLSKFVWFFLETDPRFKEFHVDRVSKVWKI